MQVVDRFQFYVEQVANRSMIVGGVADPVELQVGRNACRLLQSVQEFKNSWRIRFRWWQPARCCIQLCGVTNCIEEVRRQRRFAARELHRHLALRLYSDGIVEHGLDSSHVSSWT